MLGYLGWCFEPAALQKTHIMGGKNMKETPLPSVQLFGTDAQCSDGLVSLVLLVCEQGSYFGCAVWGFGAQSSETSRRRIGMAPQRDKLGVYIIFLCFDPSVFWHWWWCFALLFHLFGGHRMLFKMFKKHRWSCLWHTQIQSAPWVISHTDVWSAFGTEMPSCTIVVYSPMFQWVWHTEMNNMKLLVSWKCTNKIWPKKIHPLFLCFPVFLVSVNV